MSERGSIFISRDIPDDVAAGRACARWLAEFERSAQGDAA
jgi:hypothetical protein